MHDAKSHSGGAETEMLRFLEECLDLDPGSVIGFRNGGGLAQDQILFMIPSGSILAVPSSIVIEHDRDTAREIVKERIRSAGSHPQA